MTKVYAHTYEYNKLSSKKGEESSLYLPNLNEIFVSRLFRVSVRQTVMRLILPMPPLYTYCVYTQLAVILVVPIKNLAYF